MDKIIGKTLAEMVVPEDELWHIYGALPHAYDVWRHTYAEFSDNPAIFSGLGNGKRSDAVQASVYDAMLAEIYAERNKAKARRVRKPDNRTRAERLADWDAEKERRKDIHLDWVERDSRRRYGHGKTHYWDSNAERKIRHAESVARADWDKEQESIAEDKLIEAIEAEMKEWQEQLERECAVLRKQQDRYWNSLNEWLKYA